MDQETPGDETKMVQLGKNTEAIHLELMSTWKQVLLVMIKCLDQKWDELATRHKKEIGGQRKTRRAHQPA